MRWDPNGDDDFSDGVDGYRLDHVWAQYPNGPDGWGYNLDDFWEPWKAALQAVNPDVFIFAEQADWGSQGVELLTGLDAAFTKPFEFGARDALRWEYAEPLYSQMAAAVLALNGAAGTGTLMTTIGNHDVDRLASSIGDDFDSGGDRFCLPAYGRRDLGIFGVHQPDDFEWRQAVNPL